MVDNTILEHLEKRIAYRCGIACRIAPAMETPQYAYNEARKQYDSKTVLKHLIQICPDETLKLIGVTNVDLYVPVLKYVFGLSQIDGPCGIISLYRLRPLFYDRPADNHLLLERAEKTVLHELGHTMGLTHCRHRSCVMYSSTRIEETDAKRPAFCPTCIDLFHWHLQQLLS